MVRIWYLAGVMLLCPMAAFPQLLDSNYIGLLHLQFQRADFSSFNRQVEELGYPTLEANITEIGAQAQFLDGRWLTGLGWYVGFGHAEKGLKGAPSTEYRHYGLRLETSWSVLKHASWFVGPTVAINPQWSKLVLNTQSEAQGLQSALTADYQKFTRFGQPVDLGLNIQYFFALGEHSSATVSFLGGYRLDEEGSWRVDGATPWVDSGIRLSGWYAAIRFGISPSRLDKRF